MTALMGYAATEIARRVAEGELSALQVTEACLKAIESGRDLNAFLHVATDTAKKSAEAVDAKRKRGEPLGPLAGVPIAIKDALCTADAPTTCASRILCKATSTPESTGSGWRPPYDATVVERLRRADAILIGKTNMDEFAMGSTSENSGFGCVKNPWDPTRVPGGSSGGSAACVAANMTPLSIGSDTGGSIRQPAGMCGVVGVKPSYGRVSRYGLVAFASSLDQIGPIGRDVLSTARLLRVIAGPDPRDSTCARVPVGDYEAACQRDPRGLRLGIPEEYFGDGLDANIEQSVRSAIRELEQLGCETIPVSMPHTPYGVATYYIVATAEASSNLARFDGVRFGLRMESDGADLMSLYGATRDAGFGAEVKRRILLGTFVLSAGYYDAYYRKAQQVRTLIQRDFSEAFEKVDALVTPTFPSPPFKIGQYVDDPLAMYLADAYTLPASLSGVCGISLPSESIAQADHPELPVGLQLLAPAFAEERLFTLGAALERVLSTRTHERQP